MPRDYKSPSGVPIVALGTTQNIYSRFHHNSAPPSKKSSKRVSVTPIGRNAGHLPFLFEIKKEL
jgi:hypothetical protein